MGLFSALSGKIYRFNSINIPIDNGMFRKSLDTLTAENLAKVYYVVLDLSVSSIIKLPLNIDEKNIIDGLSKVSGQSTDKTREDIASYTNADSGVMKAYENICPALGRQEDSQTAILFGTTFMKIYEAVVEKIGKAVFGN